MSMIKEQMTYINIKENNTIETIDAFPTRIEAIKMLKEYRIASNYYNNAYLSQRPTKDYKWIKNKSKSKNTYCAQDIMMMENTLTWLTY